MAADVSILDQFKDVASISSWAKEDAAWCVEKGIINGSGSNFNPKGSLTREQICSMLRRTYNAMDETMKAAIEELKTNLPTNPGEQPAKDFMEDIEKLKSDVDALNTKLEDLDSLKQSMQTLTETYDTIAKQYNDLTTNFKDVMDNVNALKLLITNLKIPEAPDISEYEKIAEDLGNQVAGLQTKFDETMTTVDSKVEAITTEMKAYVDEKVGSVSGGGTVEIPEETIQSMINTVTQNVLLNLSDKITATDAVLNEIKASIETITGNLTTMKDQIKELSEDIIEIQPIPEEDDELIVDMDEDPNQPEG